VTAVAQTSIRSNPTPQPTKYALELGGQFAGFFNSFEGGDATCDVITEKLGADGLAHKHLADVKYEDMLLEFGADMPVLVHDWIVGTLARNYAAQDGAIIALDMRSQPSWRLEFSRAMIRRITFPALDASSKDPGLVHLTLAPEVTRLPPGSGQIAAATTSTSKPWLAQNFRLQIDGLDCTRVDSIESLTIDYDLESDATEAFREPKKAPVQSIPNLVFTFAESTDDTIVKWHEDFVIKGNNGAQSEKNGTLQFLVANMSDAILTLAFQNLGIFRLRRVNDSRSIARFRAEMYCEAIGLDDKSSASNGRKDPKKHTRQNDQPELKKNPGPLLRGAYAPSLANPASPYLAIAPSSPPRSRESVNPTTLKFRS